MVRVTLAGSERGQGRAFGGVGKGIGSLKRLEYIGRRQGATYCSVWLMLDRRLVK